MADNIRIRIHGFTFSICFLGASIGLAVSPIKTRRIALISGLVATIPDLDIFINYGNDLANVVNHRGFSHSLLFLSLLAPALARLLKKIDKKTLLTYRRWLVLCFLVLTIHPLLDSLTIFMAHNYFGRCL